MGRYLKSDILFYDMLYFPGVGPLPGSSYQSPWSSSPSLLITAFAEESLELCIGKNIAKSINQSICISGFFTRMLLTVFFFQ